MHENTITVLARLSCIKHQAAQGRDQETVDAVAVQGISPDVEAQETTVHCLLLGRVMPML